MKILGLVFMFLVGGIHLAHAGDKVTSEKIKGTGGIVTVLKDEGVKCFVYDAYNAGSVSCYGQLDDDLDKIETKKFTFEYRSKESKKYALKRTNLVIRKVIGDRVCYIFNGYRSGGMDCLD